MNISTVNDDGRRAGSFGISSIAPLPAPWVRLKCNALSAAEAIVPPTGSRTRSDSGTPLVTYGIHAGFVSGVLVVPYIPYIVASSVPGFALFTTVVASATVSPTPPRLSNVYHTTVSAFAAHAAISAKTAARTQFEVFDPL